MSSTVGQMEQVINKLLDNTSDNSIPYCFYIGDTEITDTLADTVAELGTSTEATLTILYQPLASKC
jgi:uncharacterized protein YpmS